VSSGIPFITGLKDAGGADNFAWLYMMNPACQKKQVEKKDDHEV